MTTMTTEKPNPRLGINAGSSHGLSKFTESEVIALRLEHQQLVAERNGRTHGTIAELHRRHPNMSRQTIELIIKRRIWRHV